MTGRRFGMAIVLRHRSKRLTKAHTAELAAFADAERLPLVGGAVLVVDSDADLAVRLATVDYAQLSVILVVTAAHVSAWLDEMRVHAEVRTLVPRRRFERFAPPPRPGCAVGERQRW